MSTSAERMRAWRARQYAAGRHFINGESVDRPRVNRPPNQEPPHGTVARYVWRRDPCHCGDCRAANAALARHNRARQRLAEQWIRANRPDVWRQLLEQVKDAH
jgi:hypothetical protein